MCFFVKRKIRKFDNLNYRICSGIKCLVRKKKDHGNIKKMKRFLILNFKLPTFIAGGKRWNSERSLSPSRGMYLP